MLSKEEIKDNIKEKDNNTVETEKIMIEIPENTNYLSLVCFFTDKDGFNANNQVLGIKSLKQRKEYIDRLESDNYETNKRIDKYIEDRQKLIEKLEERIIYFEENEEVIASDKNYSDGVVIKRFIDNFKGILELVKGEKHDKRN